MLKVIDLHNPKGNKKSAGFTTHTFSVDMKELTTTIMDGFGQKMYEFSVKK